MSQPSREKIPTKCTICGVINLVRRDYLERMTHTYRCRHCSPRWKPTTFEDRIKLSSAHRKYNLNESFFRKIDNEEKAYWLGFLSGDGGITGNRVKLRLAVRDKAHLKKFKEALQWNGRDYFHKNTNALEVYFRSLKMVADLARYSVASRKTFRVRFPDISKPLERHFIRGVFDADGCINKAIRITPGKSGQIYICYGGEFSIEGNKEFVSAIQSRLVELGLPITSINYLGKSINRVRYGGINQLRKIYNYLYENATIFLERKKKLFEAILKHYHYAIIREQKRELRIPKVELVK
jgi:hypothetical protein